MEWLIGVAIFAVFLAGWLVGVVMTYGFLISVDFVAKQVAEDQVKAAQEKFNGA
jgi:hypothetical protein